MTQITIPNTPATVSYSITAASTGPFTVPFPFFTQADVKAKIVDGAGAITELVHSTDFTFDSLDVPVAQEGTGYEGGVISLNSASGIDGTITVYRDTGIDRTANFPSTGPFDVALLNDQMNRLAAMMQEFNRDAVSIPAGSIGFTSAELPTPLALSILRWNATASSLENLVPDDLDALSANAAAIAAAASEVAAAASAAAALSSEATVEADAVAAGASEIAAAASAVAAAASEVAAEAARDAAIVNSTMYADEATGRAAVADTEYFKVIGTGDVACYEYVRVDASNSTLVATYPASAFVEGVQTNSEILEDAFTDVFTITGTSSTESPVVGRIVSPTPAATLLVTPMFEGEDIDTPVVPISVKVTGKNILDPDPDLWETGRIDDAGVEQASGSRLRLKDPQPITPSTTYSSRGGLYIQLYDAAGTFVRDISSDGYGADNGFTTSATETQFRCYFVQTQARPTHAAAKSIQIEASAVSTDYEDYYSSTKTYDSIELFKYGTIVDTVTGNNMTRRIEKRVANGTGGGDNYVMALATSGLTDYYCRNWTASIRTGVHDLLIGFNDGGDFSWHSTWNIEEEGIWFSDAYFRVNVLKTKVDAVGTEAAYFDANPIECIFDRGGFATPEAVARNPLILPPYGSVVVSATGGTTYDLGFVEVSLSSGGADVTNRVSDLETADATQDSLITGLQTQIDDLIIGSGTSDAEVIAARTSAIGAIADTTLKNRLDRTELTANRVNVQDYGAVGDGVTDDTVAILAARDAAEANDMALHFPRCADAYMIRNGILLTKSTIVTGVEDGPIRKIAAVTSDVNGALNIGDTVIPVDDSTGFIVGYDVYVGKPTSTSSYDGLRGTITAVDAGGPNEITVQAYNNSGGTGMIAAFGDGAAVASQTFPMIYTDKVVSGGSAISPEIIGVHLDGNAAANEPQAYTLSLIHCDTGQTTANKIIGCILRNSPADALSDQGSGKSLIAYNRMYSNVWHGIHIGFTNSGTLVVGNYGTGNGQDGMYFCYGNTNTRCVGNFFESMPLGFAEVGVQEDGFLTFSCNITKNCTGYAIGANTGTIVIDGMLHYGTGAPATFNISNGSVKMSGASHGGASAITLQRCTKVTLDVDFFDFTGTVCVAISEVAGDRSSFISVFGQMHGATVASVTLSNSDNCLIAPSISQPAGTVSDIIVGSTCDNNHLGFGIRKNGITDSGTNTVDAMV